MNLTKIKNFVQGFHYSIVKRNFNLYGESSRSNNGGLANLHGLMASLHPNLALSIFYRNYGRNYQTTYANAIGEGSRPINEKGLFTGLQFKLNNFGKSLPTLISFSFLG